MKKAVIYTRVSSEEQIKGSSLDEQGKKCKYLIKSKDWIVGDVYQDGGRGGENIERPELQKLMADAKESKFDIVVVYKVDRLSRSLKDFLGLQDYFTSCNVELISVLEPFDTSTPTGRLFINMLGSFAEFEHSQIKERIRMGHKAYMKKGYWKGSAPYGYEIKDKKLAIKKEEAKIVKKIFNLVSERCYDVERLTLMKLQGIVNSWNVPTKKANQHNKEAEPNFWCPSTIRAILKNSVYTGIKQVNKRTKNPSKDGNKRIVRPKEEWIEQRVPKIITQEVFDRAQVSLKRNSEFAIRRRDKDEDKLLSKLIVCSDCGRKYTYWNAKKKQKTYYYCQGTKKFRAGKKCSAKYIIDYRIEEPIWDKLKQFIQNPALIEKYISKKKDNNKDDKNTLKQIEKIDGELKKCTKKKERLLDLYLRGDINRENFKERESNLNREEDESARELNKFKQSREVSEKLKSSSLDFGKVFDKVKQNLDDIDYKTKCIITRLLIDRVETNGQNFAKVSCILPLSMVLQTNQRVNQLSKPLIFTFKCKIKDHSHITNKCKIKTAV